MKPKVLILIYLGLWAIYGIYSYSQVDPNLVLSSIPLLWKLQNWVWQLGYHERLSSSLIYLVVIVALFVIYGLMIKAVNQKKLTIKNLVFTLVISGTILFGSYPALSHDIYNYLFNAKMVLTYHANPHVKVALDFPQDPWLKFMNNVHTPAPYGYGWTIISLLPTYLGQNHLKITLILFRTLMILALGALIFFQLKLTPRKYWGQVCLFGLNPLVLIETIGNIHNDVVMMASLLGAIYSVTQAWKGKAKGWWLVAILFWGISISIKFATLMVIPGLLIYLVVKRGSMGGSQAVAHLMPLTLARSQRFLPWYLMWALSFWPMIQEKWLKEGLVLMSMTALLSYLPYLYLGGYTAESVNIRTIIIVIPPLSYLLTMWLVNRTHISARAKIA
jgi:hypothetical protein